MTEGKQLAPMETFMERVKAKLRDDIGSLLPDEAVSEMVQRAVDEEFFKPRLVPKPGRSTYSNDTIEKPSQFQEMVLEAVTPIIQKRVLKIVKDHDEEINEQIQKTINDGITKLFLKSFDEIVKNALGSFTWKISSAVESTLRSNGVIR